MNKSLIFFKKTILVFSFLVISSYQALGEEEETMLDILKVLQQDIKTLEKAVYSDDYKLKSNNQELPSNSGDVLTKHLLKLSELEEQFKILTNNFEEINFKLDKLSSRITKVQTDNQMRFQDIEKSGIGNQDNTTLSKKKKLPGSDEPKDLGSVSDTDITSTEQVQATQSVESVGTVVTEETTRAQKLLPDASAEKQYEFATSFLKVGDYETAEYALREFIDMNSNHKLAGNAQYWYGETFRVRQLYQDAATAYLDGY